MLSKIIDVVNVPLIVLNMIAAIGGGIWLAILGEWRLIVIGVILIFTGHFFLSIPLMLGIPLDMLGKHFYEKKSPLRYIFMYLTQLYTNILIVACCVVALWICTRSYQGSTLGIIPYLLWSWAIALGPWRFLLSKEPENEFSGMTLYVASVLYLIFLTSTLVANPLFTIISIVLFGIVQLVILPIANMYVATQMEKEEGSFFA